MKQQAIRLTWSVSPTASAALRYIRHRRRVPNFQKPTDLSEIIFSQILKGEILDYAPYADKLELRTYIEQIEYAQYLPKLIGVWAEPGNIPFESLPGEYALKPTNGTGNVLFSTLENPLQPKQATMQLIEALSRPPGLTEPHYALIPPRIIAEQYLGTGQKLPVDYKFMTCGGVVHAILVCSARESRTQYSLFDTSWNPLPWVHSEFTPKTPPDRPESLPLMLEIARRIATDFSQVRVDLYEHEGRPYIGELTFSPQGGVLSRFTNEGVRKLGYGWRGHIPPPRARLL